MGQMSIGAFKYWLRLKGIRLNLFGTGEKWNPIKINKEMRQACKTCLIMANYAFKYYLIP